VVIVFVSRTNFTVLQVGTEGGEPERTVDVMEFYGALKRYKLLENKVTSERVAQLKAVSKQDATRIFKQCTRTDKGTNMPRMTQVGCNHNVSFSKAAGDSHVRLTCLASCS
jgi:hypothetical protein